MDTYSLNLAMAAFVGASVVAVSAYYMHRKTLNQFLEFAKAIERDRDNSAVEEEDGDSVEHLKKYPSRTRRKGRDGCCRRDSASMPDVTSFSGGGGGQVEKRNGPLYVDAVPGGLPRLHMVPEGTNVGFCFCLNDKLKRTPSTLMRLKPVNLLASYDNLANRKAVFFFPRGASEFTSFVLFFLLLVVVLAFCFPLLFKVGSFSF